MQIINSLLSQCSNPPSGVESIYVNECTSKIWYSHQFSMGTIGLSKIILSQTIILIINIHELCSTKSTQVDCHLKELSKDYDFVAIYAIL